MVKRQKKFSIWYSKIGISFLIFSLIGCNGFFNRGGSFAVGEPKVEKPKLEVKFKSAASLFPEFNKEFAKSDDSCAEEIAKPSPVFLDKHLDKTTPENAVFIAYPLDEHVKVNEKLAQLQKCIELFDNVRDKYNILIDYVALYRQAVDIDNKHLEQLILLETERTEFYKENLELYEELLTIKNEKSTYDKLMSILTSTATSLLILGVIVITK